MLYLRTNRLRGEFIYSVFNSRGELMLYTRNYQLAQGAAESFSDYPDTREVIVAEQRSTQPKRA